MVPLNLKCHFEKGCLISKLLERFLHSCRVVLVNYLVLRRRALGT